MLRGTVSRTYPKLGSIQLPGNKSFRGGGGESKFAKMPFCMAVTQKNLLIKKNKKRKEKKKNSFCYIYFLESIIKTDKQQPNLIRILLVWK